MYLFPPLTYASALNLVGDYPLRSSDESSVKSTDLGVVSAPVHAEAGA